MATAITCGQGGSNGAEWAQRINELSLVDPRATMRLQDAATNPDQVVTDSATLQLIAAFDSIVRERSGFLVDLATSSVSNSNSVTFDSVIYTINLNMAYSGELEFGAFVNGVQGGSAFFLQGRGSARAVSITWSGEITLASGDILDFRVRNPDTGNVTVSWKSSHLRIDADWKDIIA